MSILNIFRKKRKEGGGDAAAAAPEPKKGESIKKNETSASVAAQRVFKNPYVSEKAYGLRQNREYVFSVLPEANKPEIRRAVAARYGVHVERVHIVRVMSKAGHIGNRPGRRSVVKKAIVRVAPGEKIEIA